jgi:hypothetical protein
MGFAASLLLASAAAATVPDDAPARGVVLVEARVTAQILPAAIVRQADGLQSTGDDAPHHQLSRRGNTVLVEFQ